jgi:hypothetical protein
MTARQIAGTSLLGGLLAGLLFFAPGPGQSVAAQGTPPPTLSWIGYQATVVVLQGEQHAVASDGSEAALQAALARIRAEKARVAAEIAQAKQDAERRMYESVTTQIAALEQELQTLEISSTLTLAALQQRVVHVEATAQAVSTAQAHDRSVQADLAAGIAAGLSAEQQRGQTEQQRLAVERARETREQTFYIGLTFLLGLFLVIALFLILRQNTRATERLARKIDQQPVVVERVEAGGAGGAQAPIAFAREVTIVEENVLDDVREAFRRRDTSPGGAA